MFDDMFTITCLFCDEWIHVPTIKVDVYAYLIFNLHSFFRNGYRDASNYINSKK